MNANMIESIKNEILNLDTLSSHDRYHLFRVHSNVMRICAEEAITEQTASIIQVAALLHDIGHKKISYTNLNDHEQESANISKHILIKYGLPRDELLPILDCILKHRASKNYPSTSEAAQILQDADRLDALGAIAIARTFSYDSNRPIYLPEEPPKVEYDGVSFSSINHLVEKVLKLTPDSFHTQAARKIATTRFKYVQEFVDEFLQEWRCEK